MSPPRTWLREPLDLTHLDPHLYGYETVVRAKRIGIQSPLPPLSPGDRAWMGYQIGQAGQQERQRLLIGHRTDLLAQAGPTRRTGGILDAGTGGARGVSTGIDWQQKLGSLRPSQRSFKLPYQGPNTLGPRPQHTTSFGQKVWEYVQQQKQTQARLSGGMQRLGSCWTTTVQRMEQGWRNAYGASLLAGRTQEEKLVFDAIAGTRPGTYPRLWRQKVPQNLRYRGVPGALAYLGKATVMEGDAVWRGELEPGAPLQMWYGRPGTIGHSAVLERYLRNRQGEVIGLVYSDQWRDYNVVLRPKPDDRLAPRIYGARLRP